LLADGLNTGTGSGTAGKRAVKAPGARCARARRLEMMMGGTIRCANQLVIDSDALNLA
jgi:hypothetical protein